MSSFASGEKTWIRQLGGLRNLIRQELIRRQLNRHVAPGSTVLDVGCGQGTQALWLAERGCFVTGVEPSLALRERCLDDARSRALDLELVAGTIDDLEALAAGRRFDVVCAHGLLMYLDDRDGAIELLADRMAPGGILSLVFRNGDSLAMRPGLRRDWTAALDVFGAERPVGCYVNGLGVEVRADRLGDVVESMALCGVAISDWYGVRVFNDGVAHGMAPDPSEDLDALLAAEEAAGSRDPYRSVAPLLHVVGRRTSSLSDGRRSRLELRAESDKAV